MLFLAIQGVKTAHIHVTAVFHSLLSVLSHVYSSKFVPRQKLKALTLDEHDPDACKLQVSVPNQIFMGNVQESRVRSSWVRLVYATIAAVRCYLLV